MTGIDPYSYTRGGGFHIRPHYAVLRMCGGGVLDAPQYTAHPKHKGTPMNYNNSEFLASYGLSRQLPDSDRPEIVFSGRSNVGKSSLINKLCNRKKLARVSATPGKTATINFYRVDTAYFVDLPGYGYAKVSNAERER